MTGAAVALLERVALIGRSALTGRVALVERRDAARQRACVHGAAPREVAVA